MIGTEKIRRRKRRRKSTERKEERKEGRRKKEEKEKKEKRKKGKESLNWQQDQSRTDRNRLEKTVSGLLISFICFELL